ncbi:SDR family oxidoreductase [Verticiella sediminum]|uniref:SDR family oxidoreductase n=1 Tax=Verticiella sediminum TaxID=1247510 RepID=A0A556AV09_9BURK|nr:SDR family oxidoreductase [Verticiella sediminum]TSH96782.1 SDR family oxidoreductase [Verticiella sediminum]
MPALEAKSALVTGGGSGIGRATCELFAREGARLIVADIDKEAAEQTADLVRAEGGEARVVVADVNRVEQVTAMVAAAIETYGRLDCAVNNVGISASQVGAGGQRVGDISEEAWERLICVNLTSVWRCMKYELLAMERSGGGAIVNIASIAGLVGLPGAHGYVASKHGVVGLTKAAAMDHAAAGIRVNAVCPGYIDTPMRANSWVSPERPIITRPAMKRTGKTDEVAGGVLWLCSDQASFVTGTTLAIDGGYTS